MPSMLKRCSGVGMTLDAAQITLMKCETANPMAGEHVRVRETLTLFIGADFKNRIKPQILKTYVS